MVGNWLIACRWKNVSLIFLFQILLYYKFINPLRIAEQSNSNLVLFILVSICACVITAGGNVINDYFDFELDQHAFHKTKSSLSKHQLFKLYIILISTGIIVSVVASCISGFYKSWLLFPLANALLYFYSSKLKCLPLIGNVVISFFVAGVILLLPYIYWQELEQLRFLDSNRWFHLIRSIILLFSFLFIVNLFREIIKTIEDFDEDLLVNCNSTGVFFGKKNSKRIAIFVLISHCIIGLIFAWFEANLIYKSIYTLLVLFPSVYLIFRCIKALTTSDYKTISFYTKLLMMAGIIFYIIYP